MELLEDFARISGPAVKRGASLMKNLLGIASELDSIIYDLGFLATVHQASHPANAGDVSQVLNQPLAQELKARFSGQESFWFEIEHLEELKTLRADGGRGYRSEGISNSRYFELIRPLAGRLVLITRTGSQIPAVEETIRAGEDGKLFNVIEVDDAANRIRIIYGHEQYGSIPSIESHVHLLANALSIAEGYNSPGTVHAHPPSLLLLGRHRKIRGSFEAFNAAVYTSVEGLNRNYTGLIGVVPYRQSGTRGLVDASIEPLRKHRLVLWMNHGFVARDESIRRAYTLLAYAEECAKAALSTIDFGALGLPADEVKPFLEAHGLWQAYTNLFQRSE